jgi:hypothetical protein
MKIAETDPAAMRRKILEVSFVKSLGDFLQEINGVTKNGGYIKAPVISSPNNRIVDFNGPRLQLSNDRPSGIRAVLLLLFGQGDIRTDAIGGFVTNKKFCLAGNLQLAPQKGGKRKSRKHKKKLHKTKNKNNIILKKKTKHPVKKHKRTRRSSNNVSDKI